jgi:ABC-2 type transport system ATP-binding protein
MITLAVQRLKKTIGKKEIIKDISFEVKSGEVFGFLGPNGAGKTTTIRMLVGLIRPTSGVVSICGYDVQKHFIEAMRCVGSIVENPELYKFLSGQENLEHFARMLGPVDHHRIEEVVRLVEMENRIDDKVKTYSLGMRQRLGIAQALLGKPRLLILDEPTNGLDPAGIRELRSFVRKLAHEEGISVLISSHLLGEVQMMCDRVAIISHGRINRIAFVKELLETEIGNIEWNLRPLDKGVDLLKSDDLLSSAGPSPISDVVVREDGTILCRMPFSKIDEVNDKLVRQGISVWGIRRLDNTLEDLFLELTGGDRIE